MCVSFCTCMWCVYHVFLRVCVCVCTCLWVCVYVCVCVCVGAGWAEIGCEPSDEVEHEEKAGIHPWRLALPRTGWT